MCLSVCECVVVCVREKESDRECLLWLVWCMYLLRKKKPKHFVRYFYSSALPVQLNVYSITWLLRHFLLADGLVVKLHGLGLYSSQRVDVFYNYIYIYITNNVFLLKCMTVATRFTSYSRIYGVLSNSNLCFFLFFFWLTWKRRHIEVFFSLSL